jgi:hypothetical protein
MQEQMQRQQQKQPQILRLTTPRLKKTPGAPFAQDDSIVLVRAEDNNKCKNKCNDNNKNNRRSFDSPPPG